MKRINDVWSAQVRNVLESGIVSAPRGQTIKEIIGNQMVFSMRDPLVTLAARKMNFRFAFGEAWWICSGSNAVEGPTGIAQFMRGYSRFSDDGVTMSGAYGPKFADQVTWVVDQLVKDRDTRQAVINIWRERPGPSKDIPCTLSQQYFIRDEVLHVVATMRSNDLVWGTCYDAFTFTMMAKMVQTMLGHRQVYVELGDMTLNAGSAHIYEPHWESALEQANSTEIDPKWIKFTEYELDPEITSLTADTREGFLNWLWRSAEWFSPSKS